MTDQKIEKLIGKLNNFLAGKEKLSISDVIKIDKGMDVEKLSKGDLCLAHTLLHKFHSSGSSNLEKKDIEQLHSKIKDKIKHEGRFDQLDDV